MNLIQALQEILGSLIPIQQQKIRELEAENARLRRALEDSQMIFYIGEN